MTSVRNIYIAFVFGFGAAALFNGFATWTMHDPARYLSWCVLTLVAAGFKVRLPAGLGTMSLNFMFVLIGIQEFGLGEALLMGCLGAIVQALYKPRSRPTGLQVTFNISSMACSIWLAFMVQQSPRLHSNILTATTFFLANTLTVAAVIAFSEGKSVIRVWSDSFLWSFPNYLVGAGAAWVVGFAGRTLGWQSSILLMPILYVVYRSHNLYIERLEQERTRAEQQRVHLEEVAALHRRTIETLAIAIEAKDQTTHDHLERVETYATEVGKDLGLDETQLEALRAAALLHDIGKIAVPEYIISKPGKLTPEEFEKMKTHTVVGAELVERIRFPYDVAPMVRGHHEKWNGTGYPDGLAGESIPIGARILSAVDCLDALASDRQYRRAIPLNEAIAVVQSQAGISFDPAVVEVLARRCVEIEQKARSGKRMGRLSTDVVVTRGEAPAAGFEVSAIRGDLERLSESVSGTAAAWDLNDLTREIRKCRERGAGFQIVRFLLGRLIPCEALVIYLREGEHLVPECAAGDDYQMFVSLEIPLGAGLSGWVAENGKAIVNGNPSVEPGYLNDPTKFSLLRSALAVPLMADGRIAGVISLYRREAQAFRTEELATLTAVSSALGNIPELTSDSGRRERAAAAEQDFRQSGTGGFNAVL